MRLTTCVRCGEQFLEEHEPENDKCEDCWEAIENE